MTRILPSSTSSRPFGAAPRPISICPVMAIVRVCGWPPVATGLASTLYCSSSASSAVWLDEPFCEKLMVLPDASFSERIGEFAGTNQ